MFEVDFGAFVPLSDEYDELEQAHNTTYGEFKTVRDDLHRLVLGSGLLKLDFLQAVIDRLQALESGGAVIELLDCFHSGLFAERQGQQPKGDERNFQLSPGKRDLLP